MKSLLIITGLGFLSVAFCSAKSNHITRQHQSVISSSIMDTVPSQKKKMDTTWKKTSDTTTRKRDTLR